jgi:hypothetical protein
LGDAYPLLHPLRVSLHFPVLIIRHLNQVQQGIRPGLTFQRGHILKAGCELNNLPPGEVIRELGMFGEKANILKDTTVSNRFPEHGPFPAGSPDQGGENFDHRAFTSPIGTEKPVNTAPWDLQIDTF